MAEPRVRDRSLECELKFQLSGPEAHQELEARLEELGGRRENSYTEENRKFSGPGKSTRRTSLRLRILNGGPTGILTAKGPASFHGGIKVREETEVTVFDAQAATDLLQALGFQVAFSYGKKRTVWRLRGVAVTLDTLDAGWYAEIEGSESSLEPTARELGLDPGRAVKDSYSALAKKHLDSQRKRR